MANDSVLEIVAYGAWNGGIVVDNRKPGLSIRLPGPTGASAILSKPSLWG